MVKIRNNLVKIRYFYDNFLSVKLMEKEFIEIRKEMSEIKSELNMIKQLLEELKENNKTIKEECEKMGGHINFVESVYTKLRHPLNYITGKFESDTPLPLPMYKNETE